MEAARSRGVRAKDEKHRRLRHTDYAPRREIQAEPESPQSGPRARHRRAHKAGLSRRRFDDCPSREVLEHILIPSIVAVVFLIALSLEIFWFKPEERRAEWNSSSCYLASSS